MKNTLAYKDYLATIQFSPADNVFFGNVEGVTDLVSFEGTSVDELKQAFAEAVEDYLEICRLEGRHPGKSYKGSFNVRVSKDLHRQACEMAVRRGVSLNQLVQAALEHEVTRYT